MIVMVKNIFLLLGLPEGSPASEVKEAYTALMNRLCESEAGLFDLELEMVREARQRLTRSWDYHSSQQGEPKQGNYDQESAPAEQSNDYCRPKLGQLLVSAGLLTLDELDAILEIQHNTKNELIHVGCLLVAAGYITEQQKDYYLRLQAVLKLPSDHPHRWGQRLLELGMVDDDQLKVALIEQKTTCCSLREALINRGWLTAEMLDRIF
jgi:hypothetical protein